MSFFSRLTDIVTCNLAEILANESDPLAAVQQIIDEMNQGIAGAERCVNTASRNVERLEEEIAEHSQRSADFKTKARAELAANNEDAAREALSRKSELDDLVAGLTPELKAAESTREQLNTTLRALQARLADATRKQSQLLSGNMELSDDSSSPEQEGAAPVRTPRTQEIDDQLAALRAELEQGG